MSLQFTPIGPMPATGEVFRTTAVFASLAYSSKCLAGGDSRLGLEYLFGGLNILPLILGIVLFGVMFAAKGANRRATFVPLMVTAVFALPLPAFLLFEAVGVNVGGGIYEFFFLIAMFVVSPFILLVSMAIALIVVLRTGRRPDSNADPNNQSLN